MISPGTSVLDLRLAARPHAPKVVHLPHLAQSARATWLGRMVNEHRSAGVFEAFAAQLEAAGFDSETVARCAAFADEERSHGVLCGAVVEALGGEARAPLPPAERFPMHEDATPLEGVLRNAISIACMSETVAVALIGAERLAMPEGELRTLLTRIWADEIGHARFGWALVAKHAPSLDARTRARLGLYLRVAFAHLEDHELSHLPESACPPPEGADLGLCSGSEARGLFYATVHGVIIKGLEHQGLPAAGAWEARRTPARTLPQPWTVPADGDGAREDAA